jgi:hypothetical protein
MAEYWPRIIASRKADRYHIYGACEFASHIMQPPHVVTCQYGTYRLVNTGDLGGRS